MPRLISLERSWGSCLASTGSHERQASVLPQRIARGPARLVSIAWRTVGCSCSLGPHDAASHGCHSLERICCGNACGNPQATPQAVFSEFVSPWNLGVAEQPRAARQRLSQRMAIGRNGAACGRRMGQHIQKGLRKTQRHPTPNHQGMTQPCLALTRLRRRWQIAFQQREIIPISFAAKPMQGKSASHLPRVKVRCHGYGHTVRGPSRDCQAALLRWR